MDLEWIVQTLRGLMATISLDDACAHLSQRLPFAEVRAARRVIEQQINQIRILRDPPAMEDDDLESWYPGPSDRDRFWPPYLTLLQSKGWSGEDLDALDRSSTRIVSCLHYPGLGCFKTKGLVVGYVQSGKTASYTATIAKAADVGYRMFIVLAGMTNKLRRQTQERLDAELRDLNPEHWINLTDAENDFRRGMEDNANAFLTRYASQKTLCVVKKNAGRLRNLLRWLQSANEHVIRSCPVLIVDDEADQASINTARSFRERSAVNGRILDILEALPKVAYIGFTATPFANVFIDPSIEQELYPRHFILSLPRSENYFGPERIFGRERILFDETDEETDGLDVIRSIPEEEIPFVRPNRNERCGYSLELESAPLLRQALLYFWMATAARHVRGQKDSHSTILIHTSQYADVHQQFRTPLECFRDRVAEAVFAGEESCLAEMRDLWTREQARVQSEEFGLEPVCFDDLTKYLHAVLDSSRVIIENYLSQADDRLVYGNDPGIFIVVGGNILARGLTLEGLVSSYFVRSANAYDTLLQMGRWFGYRRGYEDLPRIWMTDRLRGFFFELATVEREMRHDISRYQSEGLTPLEFAPRIRTHPQLLITSRLKMSNAVECCISYHRQRLQTILFNHQDQSWLEGNIRASQSLIKRLLLDYSLVPEEKKGSYWLLQGAPMEEILNFLSDYRFHEESWNLRADMISEYIQQEYENGSLATWNVGVISQSKCVYGTLDLGLPCKINLISRTKMEHVGGSHANIKALMSRSDMVIDLDAIPSAQASKMSWDRLSAERQAHYPDRGLLLLYPISKASKPTKPSESREALNASENVIGVAIVFPDSVSPARGRKYVTADLSGIDQDEIDIPEEELE